MKSDFAPMWGGALVCVLLAGCNSSPPRQFNYDYGSRVRYMSDSGKGKPLKFPDFTITYIGKTPYRFNGMEKYDFSVRSPQQMKKVAWIKSGIFVPTTFQIDGKHFLLEVDTSEKIRGVQPGEMVITHK